MLLVDAFVVESCAMKTVVVVGCLLLLLFGFRCSCMMRRMGHGDRLMQLAMQRGSLFALVC